MSVNAQGFCVLQNIDFTPYLDTFAGLPADPYCPKRSRRFSQYRITHENGAWTSTKLPHRPLIQPRKNNTYVGGILRHLEPLVIDVADLGNVVAKAIPIDTRLDWQIDVHQWRTFVDPSPRSIEPVPEGIHSDGHAFGAVLVAERYNITGGVTTLYTPTDPPTAFFDITLQPGDGIVFDDQKLLHFTSSLTTEMPEQPGIRDIFVLDFNVWEHRRYGEAFEQNAIGGLLPV